MDTAVSVSAFAPFDEHYEARCRVLFDRQPIMKTLGCRLAVVRPGYAELEMPFDPAFTQQTGAFQAGVMAILGDNAGGFAGYSLFPPNADILAVEFKINFLAPGIGDLLRAVGRVVKPGRTLTVCDVEIYGITAGVPKLCAKMQQTAMRVDRKPDAAA